MDTKQKTRSGASAGSRRTAEKNTKKSAGLFGLGQKKKTSGTARQTANRTASAAQKTQQRRTPEEAARRREAAARQRQAEAMQTAAQQAEQEAIPEMVFKPTEEETQKRIRTPEENKRSAIRRRSAKRAQERKEEVKRIGKRPNVTYTQPVPFNLQRLLLQLAGVVAVVLAVVMGLSVFFKVERVMVYGNRAYSAWDVQEAGEIEIGDNLLTFGSTRACGKITTRLPYVNTVRIGIKLPDTVNIYVEEFDVVYSVEAANGDWWLMTSGGKMVEKIDPGISGNYTKVLGVKVDNPTPGTQAKAEEKLIPVTQETAPEGETVSTEPVYTITGADKLKAALLILDALELNDVVGEASSIDVSSLNNLELMYGSRYQVKLGDSEKMEYKISCMKQAVAQLNEYQTGILDVSFTTWTDRPGYTPFE